MLIQLDIDNIAVIEHISIEFGCGLNVITGETGAGKSLIINALNLVLGGRASHELIRENAPYAKVNAVFFIDDISSFEEYITDSDDRTLIIDRKFYSDGRNVCRINGETVSVSVLRKIGSRLIVAHGQRDETELFNEASHIELIDSFIKDDDFDIYSDIYVRYKKTFIALSHMNSDEEARRNEADYLTYQLDELRKAALSENEEDELLSRRKILENAEALRSHAEKAMYLISGDGAAKELLHGAMREIEKLCETDSECEEICEKISDIYYESEELAHRLSSYASRVEFSQSELEAISERLDLINSLKRKYNRSVSEIILFEKEAAERLNKLISYNEDKSRLLDEYESLRTEAISVASRISKKRKKIAEVICEKLISELSELDMPKCSALFDFSECDLCENGIDKVRLLLSTNPSDAPKPLEKIVSGGEMSRIMLAIKSVFRDYDKVPTLLFDEIDTGISGRAAEKIATKMRALSASSQIISVTHLPITAAAGHTHILVEKQTDSSFKSTVKILDADSRKKEIARIISGDNINEISLSNAGQLLEMYNS